MDPSQPSVSPIIFGSVLVVLVFMTWYVTTRNKIVRLRNLVRESWSDVEVALKRRHDLIPNLVATVQGYAKHERETLELVVRAREEALCALGHLQSLGVSEAKLESALRTILVHAEAYPELKADQHFLELQAELSRTEDRIAAARRLYNANVRDLNTSIESFPAVLIVGSTQRADYFELTDRSSANVPQLANQQSVP